MNTQIPANPSHASSGTSARIPWLNNLRTFLIFLVVLVHASGVYEASGSWASFWIVDDAATNNVSGLIFLVLDIFVMPMMFLISGYLTPASIARRTPSRFISGKIKRLMLPWLAAVLTLIPLYKVIFLASRGLPQQEWSSYFHWTNGNWGMNWLWFLPALFLFNLLYLTITKLPVQFPNWKLKTALPIAFVAAFAYSLGIDLMGLRGWTHFLLIDFQHERLLIYFIAFLLGARCFRLGTFNTKPSNSILYHIGNATNWIPLTAYIILLLMRFFSPDTYLVSELVHRSLLWLSYHTSLFSIGYTLIETFRRYFNHESAIGKELSQNSYGVYILHVIVQGAIAWWMLSIQTPSLLKYGLLTLLSWLATNLLISVYRWTLTKILNSTTDHGKTIQPKTI